MKVTINFDCTAEEARTFLGLPDVSPLNEKYVQATLNTMEGATNLEQMDKLLRSFSRSEEHTSELQSLMRISYAVFCLIKKKQSLVNNPSSTHNNNTTKS